MALPPQNSPIGSNTVADRLDSRGFKASNSIKYPPYHGEFNALAPAMKISTIPSHRSLYKRRRIHASYITQISSFSLKSCTYSIPHHAHINSYRPPPPTPKQPYPLLASVRKISNARPKNASPKANRPIVRGQKRRRYIPTSHHRCAST